MWNLSARTSQNISYLTKSSSSSRTSSTNAIILPDSHFHSQHYPCRILYFQNMYMSMNEKGGKTVIILVVSHIPCEYNDSKHISSWWRPYPVGYLVTTQQLYQYHRVTQPRWLYAARHSVAVTFSISHCQTHLRLATARAAGFYYDKHDDENRNAQTAKPMNPLSILSASSPALRKSVGSAHTDTHGRTHR